MSKTKKRFIAGAVCPACSEPDKLMMWSEDGVLLASASQSTLVRDRRFH